MYSQLGRIFLLYWSVVSVECGIGGNTSTFTVGTVLFTSADIHRECWSPDDASLLTARMLVRNLMPHVDTLHVDSDKFVTDIIEYFRIMLEVVRGNTYGKTKHIMLLALTDVLGGYMKHLVLPMSKYAYYAGNVEYSSVVKLYQLYDEVKNYLQTNGNSWAKPWKRAGKRIKVKALALTAPAPTTDPCKGLIYIENQPGQVKGCNMDIPLPFFDSKTHPSAIAVPFKTFGLRNLESRVSAYILVKFFVAVSKCMASRNVVDEDVQKFNVNVYSFIMSKVMPRLYDDKFYSAFGGVLRILETIKQSGKSTKQLGQFNIMPEGEDKEPCNDDHEEDVPLEYKPQKTKLLKKKKKSKSDLILIAALSTIAVWFCLGAAFICCRLRASKGKTIKEHKPSIKGKKGLSDTTDDVTCTVDSCPGLRDESRSSSMDDPYAMVRYTGNKSDSTTRKSSLTSGGRGSGHTGKESAVVKAPQLDVQSVQYYPPTFACHTSMTGNVKVESSTDDLESQEEPKRPFVFGYDFQTTSEEDSSPRGDTTDGDANMGGGNMSK